MIVGRQHQAGGPRTLFEQEVERALLAATDPLYEWHPFDRALARHIKKLAPRVAAAIDAGSRNTESVDTARAAGLAVLRGCRIPDAGPKK